MVEIEKKPLLIVGLGNPGAEYKNTRHNVGFDVIDRLSLHFNIPVKKRTMRAVLGDGLVYDRRVWLVKPMTYMNLSGESVGALARMYRLHPDQILVIVDDVALPIGRLRLRPKGSAGGHNGLTSIEKGIHSQEYPRFRIGVGGAQPGRMIDHVLGKFSRSEQEEVNGIIRLSLEVVETIIKEGFDKAMNVYNTQSEPPPK